MSQNPIFSVYYSLISDIWSSATEASHQSHQSLEARLNARAALRRQSADAEAEAELEPDADAGALCAEMSGESWLLIMATMLNRYSFHSETNMPTQHFGSSIKIHYFTMFDETCENFISSLCFFVLFFSACI